MIAYRWRMQLKELSSENRRRLLRFVCSFAWADLEVVDAEREMIGRLIDQMELDEAETAEVKMWIARPPDPASIDPQEIPQEHRQLFLDTVTAMVLADGEIAEGEAENLDLFRMLIA
jgi:uncharacterized tellurite resistance protein B-like protein